jgi:hypothetical protein
VVEPAALGSIVKAVVAGELIVFVTVAERRTAPRAVLLRLSTQIL